MSGITVIRGVRLFSTGRKLLARFRSATLPTIKEIGLLMPTATVGAYEPGQIFIHRTFAYKGVVVCSFPCRVHEKRQGQNEKLQTTREFYQVLIHRHDWSHMGFPVDITSYLVDSSNSRNGEKLLTLIKWGFPLTDNIEVTVLTFYLGANVVGGQQQHMWRYVIRIENKVPEQGVILRERTLKVYSLNNMNQMHGHGVIGKQPELNVASPAFQFSSTIELKHSKGGHMWGRFKMERENGVIFDVHIPTIVLESTDEVAETTVSAPEQA